MMGENKERLVIKAKLPLIIKEGIYTFHLDGSITLAQSEDDRTIIIHGSEKCE